MINKNRVSEGFDIIGDVHGQAEALRALLGRLGYAERGGCFRHPARQAVFVGDLVDRGPDVAGVLDLVRRMTDGGAARVVIGNHDYNLLCWYTPSPTRPHEFLRVRGEKNRKQAETSLAALDGNPALRAYVFDWLLDLPLYLDLGGARVVHACWCERSMVTLGGATTLRACDFGTFERQDSPAGDALALLLCGYEMLLPEGKTYKDRYGVDRKHLRVRWWLNRPGATLAELSVAMNADMPAQPAPAAEVAKLPGYGAHEPPLFIGHYGFRSPPGSLRPNIACVDYASPTGGPIGAYRWSGERELKEENFV